MSSSKPEAEPKPLPHYALPNFSVVLPTFSNHESDVITQAFRVGNYVSLHDLPNGMKPGQVSRSRFQKILDNREPVPIEGDGKYKAKAKYFSEFEYIPSPYSMVEELQKEERLLHEQVVAGAGHEKTFVMSDTSVKQKQDNFTFGGDPFNAYASAADPYERADDQSLRYQWLQDAQILAGPFKPSGRVKGSLGQAATERPSRQTVPEIVRQLREAIEEDWGEYPFLVCSTDDEHLVIRFEIATLDSEPGLVAYMNVFSRTNLVVNKYLLKKVVEDWNVTPGDGHLYFTFRPPWITVKMTDTIFSLHPEMRSFQAPRFKHSAFTATDDAYGSAMPVGSSDLSGGLGDERGAAGAVERPQMA